MRSAWRLLICAAAMTVLASAGPAAAQTLIVRKVPRGATIELVVNAKTVASTVVDAGEETLPVDLSKNAGKQEIDAHMFIDQCAQVQRFLIVERGVAAPSSGGCSRTEIAGFFALRGVTTMVVDVAATPPAMYLRQGPAPKSWLSDDAVTVRDWGLAPAGLVFGGGAGLARFSNALGVACGTVIGCTGDDMRFAYAINAAYWFNQFIGAEVGYLKPLDVTAGGVGSTFQFDSHLQTQILTLVGKVGAPLGVTRVYGQGGMDYHQATLTTTERINDTTITVGGVPTTIPGGTQVLALNTSGYGYLVGGGIEIWPTPRFAFYGEVGFAWLKGSSRNGGEGTLDDRVLSLIGGAKVHIGR